MNGLHGCFCYSGLREIFTTQALKTGEMSGNRATWAVELDYKKKKMVAVPLGTRYTANKMKVNGNAQISASQVAKVERV